MPFDFNSIEKYLPLINTGLNVAGQYLGGRAQNQAITRASGINQQATNQAMNAILGMYDEGQSALTPYRNLGPAALNALQMQLYGKVPAPASIQAPPVGNAMTRFAGASAANPLASSGSGRITNAMLNAQGQTAGQEAAARRGRISGIGATAGGIAGTVFGGPVGGLVGGAIGGLEGKVISKFGANNPYKSAASRGIDEVSREIWGGNTPGIPPEQLQQGIVADAIHGRKPVAQAKQEINALLNEWIDGMRANGTPDSVLQSSISTQRQYLQPLNPIFQRLDTQPPPASA